MFINKSNIFFILTAFFASSLAHSAQADVVKLKLSYSPSEQLMTLTVRKNEKSFNCKTYVYGSLSKTALAKNVRKGARLAGLRNTAKKVIISVAGVPPVSPGGKSRVFIRSSTICGKKIFVGALQSLKIISTDSSQPVITEKEFLPSLRAGFLKKGFTVEETFPDHTCSKPVDFQNGKEKNGRIFIVEQNGIVKSVLATPTGTEVETVLDLTMKVSTGGERGLVGLAMHPSFESNGLFYVNYTRAGDGATVISSFIYSGATVDPAQENIILTVEQPFASHNGGSMFFGKDNFLYIALGDGGSVGDPLENAQNRNNLLGKIIRINVNSASPYTIPSDNPYVNNSNGFRPEIWAYGLRNPWKISLDKKKNRVWAADVGQDSVEEINVITAGGNYGWNIKEGSECFAIDPCNVESLIAPVHEYGRSLGRSVTGGFVYRGKLNPNYHGVYFFADFISGRIFALEKVAGRWSATELLDTESRISSFGQDRNGELYFLSYTDGKVFKMGYLPQTSG